MSDITLSTDDAMECVYNDNPMQKISKHRWYTRYLVVFQHETGLRGFYYDEPATEEQEGQEVFEADPVPTFPVKAEQLTITRYSRVEE